MVSGHFSHGIERSCSIFQLSFSLATFEFHFRLPFQFQLTEISLSKAFAPSQHWRGSLADIDKPINGQGDNIDVIAQSVTGHVPPVICSPLISPRYFQRRTKAPRSNVYIVKCPLI